MPHSRPNRINNHTELLKPRFCHGAATTNFLQCVHMPAWTTEALQWQALFVQRCLATVKGTQARFQCQWKKTNEWRPWTSERLTLQIPIKGFCSSDTNSCMNSLVQVFQVKWLSCLLLFGTSKTNWLRPYCLSSYRCHHLLLWKIENRLGSFRCSQQIKC